MPFDAQGNYQVANYASLGGYGGNAAPSIGMQGSFNPSYGMQTSGAGTFGAPSGFQGTQLASPTPGGMPSWLNWGNASQALGAAQGAIGLFNAGMDLFGKSDADKQRKFAKTFTMREANTRSRLHDNNLQMTRNIAAAYNDRHGTNYNPTAGLKSLGQWGSKKGRVLADNPPPG